MFSNPWALLPTFRRILESGPVDLESLQLAYPPRTTPEFVLKNGWCPPPESKPDLPFQVCARKPASIESRRSDGSVLRGALKETSLLRNIVQPALPQWPAVSSPFMRWNVSWGAPQKDDQPA